MRKLLLDIREKNHLYGFLGLCGYAFEKLMWLMHIRLWIRNVYAKPTDYVYKGRTDYVAEEISYDMLRGQYPKNRDWFTPKKIKSLQNAEKHRDRIVGIFDKDLLVAYGLVSFSTMYIKNVRLKNSDSYLWDCYVHPMYRGRRLHEVINRTRINLSAQENRMQAVTVADWYNRASKRAKEHEGFEKKETYVYFRFRRWIYCSLKYDY